METPYSQVDIHCEAVTQRLNTMALLIRLLKERFPDTSKPNMGIKQSELSNTIELISSIAESLDGLHDDLYSDFWELEKKLKEISGIKNISIGA